MNAVVALLWLAAAPPLSGPPLQGANEPVFSRPEPNLQAGAALLRQGDAEGALTSFRKATGKDANERAIIEFDVGQALLEQAQQDAKAAPEADGGPQKIDVADARAAFDRAFGLAADPSLKSEAQLASGNAAALGGDLEGAIAAYRKALVADRKNERAKKNLLRVLAAKQQQPPPPPSEGGENDSDENKDEEKKDEKKDEKEEKKDDEKKDPKDGDKGDPKKEDDKKEQGKDGASDQKEEKKDEKEEKEQKPESGEQQDEKDKKEEGKGAPKPQPKQQKREDARKLLDALRSREKPLSPLEMRGTAKSRPKEGKDW